MGQKWFSSLCITIFASSFTTGTCAQTQFQNLNFEAANVTGDTPGTQISILEGLPGWSAFGNNAHFGIIQVSQIDYDILALSQSALAINDINTGFGFKPLQGNFSAYLAGGEGSSGTLYQTGLVPVGTQSLQIEVQTAAFNLGVSLGGQFIEMMPLITTPAFTIYGGNVSGFAGQIAELDFTEPDGPSLNIATLDNIIFSPASVPEPQTYTLLLCAAALALKCRQHK
jgi:hypothetical protein